MATLALRLTLTPCVVLLTSFLQRRLGPLRGGRVVGLPLTTGPFLAVICLEYGRPSAAHAAAGVIAGQLVVVGFCVGYGHLAAHVRPLWSLVGALTTGAVAGAVVAAVEPAWLAATMVVGAIAVALVTWPSPSPSTMDTAVPVTNGARVVGQTALRMAAAGGLVALLVATAQTVGAFLAGLLSSAPVILTVLVPSTHRSAGPVAAGQLVRGTLVSMPGAIVFTTVVAYTVDRVAATSAFLLAGAALAAVSLLPWARLSTPNLGYHALRKIIALGVYPIRRS